MIAQAHTGLAYASASQIKRSWLKEIHSELGMEDPLRRARQRAALLMFAGYNGDRSRFWCENKNSVFAHMVMR
jgi:hypothetical protein